MVLVTASNYTLKLIIFRAACALHSISFFFLYILNH